MRGRFPKGTVLQYTGPYADDVPEDAKYGKGEVVWHRKVGTDDAVVVVRLIDELEELYADWPMNQVEEVM